MWKFYAKWICELNFTYTGENFRSAAALFSMEKEKKEPHNCILTASVANESGLANRKQLLAQVIIGLV